MFHISPEGQTLFICSACCTSPGLQSVGARAHCESHSQNTKGICKFVQHFYFDPLVEKHEWIAPLFYKEISGGILNLTIL